MMLPFCLFSQKVFHPGIQAGMTFSQISGDDARGFNRMGPFLGGFINAKIGNNQVGGFGINYIEKGSRILPDRDIGQPLGYKLDLRYLEVPVYYQYHYHGFSAEAGLNFGFLIHQREQDDSGDIFPQRDFTRLDFSIQGGIAYNLFDNLSIAIHYSNSFLPVREHTYGRLTRAQTRNIFSYIYHQGQYNSVITAAIRFNISSPDL